MSGFVQQVGLAGNFNTISSLAVPITNNTTQGNTIIGIVKTGSGAPVSSVTDTQGNTWTVDVQSALSGPSATIIRCYLKTALTTANIVTVNFTSNNGNCVILCEYTGKYATIDELSKSQGGSPTSATLTASNALQSSTDLVVAGIGTGGNTNQTSIALSSGVPSNMLRRSQGPSGFNVIAQADGLSAANTAPSASWSWTSAATYGVVLGAYGLVGSNTFFDIITK